MIVCFEECKKGDMIASRSQDQCTIVDKVDKIHHSYITADQKSTIEGATISFLPPEGFSDKNTILIFISVTYEDKSIDSFITDKSVYICNDNGQTYKVLRV